MSAAVARAWAPAAALIAIAYLVVMAITGALPERRQLVKAEINGVMDLAPESITRVTVTTADQTSTVYLRRGKGWVRESDSAVAPRALVKSLDLAVKFMHTANPVRVFKPEDIAESGPADFGLDRPRLSITLESGPRVVLEADFGNNRNDGLLQYMRLRGHGELYLMSGFVGKEWTTVANAAKP